MTDTPKSPESKAVPTLDELRQKIDRIDETVHRALIERSEIVEALIAVKRTDKPGAAFRPGREMDMMRRLVARHRGSLPITTVEHLWREIIATFTHMQAPFDVVVEPGSALRDVARFYFGFTVGFRDVDGKPAVIDKVRAGEGSVLGVVGVERKPETAWWLPLSLDGVQVIARLPVIVEEGRPAAADAFVLSMPLMDTTVPDLKLVALYAAKADGVGAAIAGLGGSVVSEVNENGRCEILAAVPFSVSEATLGKLATREDNPISCRGAVGGYWTPINLG